MALSMLMAQRDQSSSKQTGTLIQNIHSGLTFLVSGCCDGGEVPCGNGVRWRLKTVSEGSDIQ